MDSATDAKLAAAYETGDTDEILRLLGATTLFEKPDPLNKSLQSPPSAGEQLPSLCAPSTQLTATAKEFVPSSAFSSLPKPGLQNAQCDVSALSKQHGNENWCAYDGTNGAVQSEHIYSIADSENYSTYVSFDGTAQSDELAYLFSEQALLDADPGVATLDESSRANYVAAVATFNAEFPALGGKPNGAGGAMPQASADADAQGAGSLVARMRLERLQGMFGWVDSAVVSRALDACGGSLSGAEAALHASYPRPAWWDAQQRAATEAANAASAARRARAGGVLRRTRDVGASWVSTGDSVRALYERLRAEAGAEARARNAAFDRARGAAIRGDRAAAARFGALGRAANDRMKALHMQAADAIFEARNPPGSAERGLVDMHGLHVAEALERLPEAVSAVRTTTVRILTGSGHHTKGTGKARLRPAVREWLDTEGYRYEEVVDKNSHVGAFIVHL